jgi:D-alanyl-D-alanine carboxypeptidase
MRGKALPVRFRRIFGTTLRPALALAAALGAYGAAAIPAAATPAIVIDAQTGDVLYAEDATENWYPASLTKLMTFYVALAAVRDHKISLDTPILISARAAAQAPSKMGFKPGTELTLGNALKMMMVKSANDLAVAVAEAVSGSVDAFAEDMNATAAQLGMRQTHFANPNGLPNPQHVSSARDLAILARAIYQSFPQEAEILSIGALRLGDELVPGHNSLLGRYPGTDGMKTGFTCAAGFNLITSSRRNGHHYIAVVLGAPDVKVRMMKSAVLLDRAFDGIDHPIEKLDALDPGAPLNSAPDMHNQVCRGRAKAVAAWQSEITQLEAPLLAASASGTAQAAPAAPGIGLFAPITSARLTPVAPTIAMMPKPVFEPVPVFLGPAAGYQGPVAQARPPHSAVGTPPLPGTAVAEKPAANTEATDAEEEKPKVAVSHHRTHKAVKVAAHGKAHRHHVAKAETKEAIGDKDPAPKHHASKKAHGGKTAKVAKATSAKKHVAAKHLAAKHVAAKHVAAKPAQ